MTTTVTVGAAGAGLAAAAAVAGAVGLGLAGLAGLALHGGRGRKNRGYGGYGYRGGYGHGGHGHGHGGYGYHRRRRAVQQGDEGVTLDEELDEMLDGDEEDAEALERVLLLVRAQDLTGCGRRLVCELGGADPHQLTIEELAILNLVGSGVRPGEGILPGASGEYKAARGLGEAGGDCAKAYPSCPYNGKNIMKVVNDYIP